MKNQMLSACPLERRAELQDLFQKYPFQEMSADYARANNWVGVCWDGAIWVVRSQNSRLLLATYLHELAHSMLYLAGRPDEGHGQAFLQLCRELEARFAVTEFSMHEYDSQDARTLDTDREVKQKAASAAVRIGFDPEARAQQLADSENSYDMRILWQYGVVIGLPPALFLLYQLVFVWAFNAPTITSATEWWNTWREVVGGVAFAVICWRYLYCE